MGDKDFFVSYTSADRTWAEWIAWQLEAAGYSTVFQLWDFRPGSNFVIDMRRGATAERTIAVLSPNYFASPYAEAEWAAAFAQDPTGEKGILVPVRVRQIDLTGLDRTVIYVDLVGLPEDEAQTRLLDGVRQRRAKPSAAPSFPEVRQPAEQPGFPGRLPGVWNVPRERSPIFTGRARLLELIQEDLADGPPHPRMAVLTGLGGVGKTQIAVEHAFGRRADYDVVWWIHAQHPEVLAGDYAALAGALGLPERDHPDRQVAVAAVRRWLEGHGRWLLVFDDAQEAQAIQQFLPRAGGGTVLVTSRNPAWRRHATAVLEIDPLDQEQAAAFLSARTGHRDPAAARAVADALGGLPLALEQAGAYVEDTGMPLAAYLTQLHDRAPELFTGDRADHYGQTVATTWQVSLDQVRESSAEAVDVLRLCAWLAPDDIPRELIEQGTEILPQPLADAVREGRLDEVAAVARRYSLLSRSAATFSVHRLVQGVVRDGLGPDERRTWAGTAVRLVAAALPTRLDDLTTWPTLDRLLPHALAATDHGLALQAELDQVGFVLHTVATYLDERGKPAEARAAHERALKAFRTVHGSQHHHVAASLTGLGNALRGLGDAEGAMTAHRDALGIIEEVYGPDSPEAARSLGNIGNVLRDLGDLRGARTALEGALDLFQTTLGPASPEISTSQHNLAIVLKELGDLDGARELLERAITIDRATFGPDHPHVASIRADLGTVLTHLGDLTTAQGNFEHTLASFRAAYGPTHPSIAAALNSLGIVAQKRRDLGAARTYYEQALDMRTAVLGPNHPETAASLGNLGSLLVDLGDLDGARDAQEKSLRIFQTVYRDDHPSVAQAYTALAGTLLSLGDLAGAREHAEQAVAANEERHDAGHPALILALDRLAEAHARLGDLSAAEHDLERLLAARTARYGNRHPDVAATMANLGGVLAARGRIDAARRRYRQAMDLFASAYGERHPTTLQVAALLYDLPAARSEQ
jgi:tetratricopeptide (TPR) repeat protein